LASHITERQLECADEAASAQFRLLQN
jgi:hypothetical protein